jgi:hypothetical protein
MPDVKLRGCLGHERERRRVRQRDDHPGVPRDEELREP